MYVCSYMAFIHNYEYLYNTSNYYIFIYYIYNNSIEKSYPLEKVYINFVEMNRAA